MNGDKHISRLVPNELVPGLRLSKWLPNTMSDSSHAHVQIVHGEDFTCLGYLVCRIFRISQNGPQYHIYATELNEAARLAGMDEEELKQAYQMPDPEVLK